MDTSPRYIAAIDLGSNSFHMVVAKVTGPDLQLVSRHKQRVRLASGLDKYGNLDHASMQRGLDCLSMFAERLSGFEPGSVRIAATHTLRQAKNAHLFLQRALEVLPYPIEVISGVEEGRLIFVGVAHTQPESEKKLVIDIGGGSTEMIIGSGFEPSLVNSKRMGCVSYTNKYFANGKLSNGNFTKADMAARQKLESIEKSYRKSGWDSALGSSGTIKAIREVLIGLGFEDGVITTKRLKKLIEELCRFSNIDEIELEGLAPERKPVFAAGVAILNAVLTAFKVSELHYSDGALREGLLYEMEDRFARSDIRMRTTENLAQKHHVDLDHAARVRDQAEAFFSQLSAELEIKKEQELGTLLGWTALLHEVGLSISYQGFHRHSEYILRHTNMPGFNQEQQLVLATLARFQRKALKLKEMPDFSLFKSRHIISLIRILRLSILLHGQRNDEPLPELNLELLAKDHWRLSCSNQEEWLEQNRLLQADLVTEQEQWQSAGWQLEF